MRLTFEFFQPDLTAGAPLALGEGIGSVVLHVLVGRSRVPGPVRLRTAAWACDLHVEAHLIQPLEWNMLSWAIGFFIVAIIAAVFGFGGIASGAAGIAKILFFLFLIAFVVSLVMGLMRGRGPRL
jgi:uncharacterized membrane protein YtjA (UPF0391 family)